MVPTNSGQFFVNFSSWPFFRQWVWADSMDVFFSFFERLDGK